MLLTLFYPRELKQIIAELRAEDDLNEGALKVIHVRIFLFLAIASLVIFSSYVMGYSLYVLLITMGVSLVGCFYVAHETSTSLMLPYTLGDEMDGEISHIEFSKSQPASPKGWRFIYEFVDSSNNKIKKQFPVVLDENMIKPNPCVGTTIKIFVHPHSSKCNAPLIPSYFEKLCLSKSRVKLILKETENVC